MEFCLYYQTPIKLSYNSQTLKQSWTLELSDVHQASGHGSLGLENGCICIQKCISCMSCQSHLLIQEDLMCKCGGKQLLFYKRWCLFSAISWLQYNLSGDHKKSQLVVHFPLCINDKDCLDQWPRDRKFKVQAIASIIKIHRAKKYITFQTHSIPPFCKT